MAWFPKEACAILLDNRGEGELVLADNEQDKLHAADSATYDRTAETANAMNPLLIANAEAEGKRLIGIVHSHCRVGAYFSEKDQQDATCPFSDEPAPLYPGVDYVVLDAQDQGVQGYKIFGWSMDSGGFLEQ